LEKFSAYDRDGKRRADLAALLNLGKIQDKRQKLPVPLTEKPKDRLLKGTYEVPGMS
jgi:hypothetical protein